MANILITNAWHDDNKGDSGIILGIMELFSFNSQSQYCLLSEFSEKDVRYKNAYKHILQAFPNTQILASPWPILPVKQNRDFHFIGKLYNKLLIKALPKHFSKKRKQIVFPLLQHLKQNDPQKQISHHSNNSLEMLKKNIYESDIIVSKGGSFIYSDGSYEGNLRLARVLYPLYIGLTYKKPIVIFGQSIWGLENEIAKKTALPILKKSMIFTREHISKEYLKNSLDVDATVVPDPAFYLSNSKKSNLKIILTLEKYIIDGYKLIGITVRDWHFKYGNQTFVKKILKIFELVEKKIEKIIFVLVPQVIGPVNLEDDRIIMKSIYENAQTNIKRKMLLILDDYSPYELKKIYAKMDLLIGTRLHSLIFAFTENVPGIAISYSPHKHEGIMKMIGLQDYIFQIENFNPEEVVFI